MSKVLFDRIVFEARYAFGYTYLDRAGQILIDIEKGRPGWVPGDISPQGGKVSHPERGYHLTFDAAVFSFTTTRLENPEELKDPEGVATEIEAVWKIVRTNLGVKEFPRIAVRFFFLVAADSEDAAERILEKSPLKVALPADLSEKYKLHQRSIVAVVKGNDDVEYRIDLHGITQTTTIGTPQILVTPTKFLAKGQRNAQIELARARERYGRDPRYAASLDIDCVQYDPASFSPKEFVLTRLATVERDFKPLIKQ